MGELIETLFAIVVIVAVVLVAAGAVILPRHRARRSWSNLAARTGLVFTPGKYPHKEPELSGTYRGFPLRLFIELRGDSDHSAWFTCAEVKLNHQSGYEVGIMRKSLGQKIGELFGSKGFQTGDAELDRRLVVEGFSAQRISPILRAPALRQKLLAVRPERLFISSQYIVFQKHGELTNEAHLLALFDLMADLAAALEKSIL